MTFPWLPCLRRMPAGKKGRWPRSPFGNKLLHNIHSIYPYLNAEHKLYIPKHGQEPGLLWSEQSSGDKACRCESCNQWKMRRDCFYRWRGREAAVVRAPILHRDRQHNGMFGQINHLATCNPEKVVNTIFWNCIKHMWYARHVVFWVLDVVKGNKRDKVQKIKGNQEDSMYP